MKKFLLWLPVVMWMALIFYLSHQPGTASSELSSGLTDMVVGIAENIIPGADINLDFLEHFIRKNAHFFAYFLLGIFVLNALRKKSGIKVSHAGWALFICTLYAASDEFHQYFIPGRSAEVRDVLLDSSGALTGILLFLLFKRRIRGR
ncbi:VanZ family protein [Cytobacillus purgationiresistens]|uniref:VanZ family protein n=1 Tax=Cytobacillus purgationiresistens TaxID=863449 RepID=A0ABU0AD26_9BACI|nr:VanZ family protein [Cytobacillus purgationiresistens]MDQ0269161.1 VanZ family protein [Cytobacillus purgationiresistens]